ncbi:hypothetical protein NP493_848g00028 [Ridgeia piscesae]|uniref:Uncharacterized protein n=1 Tax=Ridgeia piscesae TaxID=27915 RepID=A0AAD9NKM5_RIDPI|nr:hypothetical protein NP493_848g00028 [Ridgeia piscesae]
MAGKTCVTVSNSQCYNNKEQYSFALNSRWYDVCANFYHTVDRGRSYAFMGAYAQEPPAFLFAKAGSSVSSVSPATQTVGNMWQ